MGAEGGDGQAIDLRAALERSVRKAQEGRGEPAEVTDSKSRPTKKAPAEKAATAKKTPLRKATQKAPTKKTAPKRKAA
ncbi:hypothetical protein ABZ618_07115 [Streptomyces roseolus]|uniref:hypothetical protein n=1 Tax=Streptomyces roseolus TaxID=67358 RepID=UPI0033CE72C2